MKAWMLLLLLATPARADTTITKPDAFLSDTTIAGDLNVWASGAVIKNVVVKGSLDTRQANDAVLVNVTVLGPRWTVNKGNLSSSRGMSFKRCHADHLGEGVTSGDHILLWWDDDGTTVEDCSFTVTHNNPSTDATHCEYHFSSRNRIERRNQTVYVMNAPDVKTNRWRNSVDKMDHPSTVAAGCYNNLFDHCTWTATGPGAASSRWCPSSSSTCDGSTPNCLGHWNSAMLGCEFHMAGGTMEWQGGFQGWKIDSTLFDGNVTAFDIARDTLRWCRVTGKWAWTDQYQRSLWQPGAVQLWGNTFAGGVSVAPTLAAIAGAMVTNAPDMTPPAPITNLVAAQPLAGNVRLTWTPPADAVRYEVHVGTFAQLQTGTAAAVPLTSLGPGAATVQLPSPGVWWRIALYSYDAAGNRSAMSNVASAYSPLLMIAAAFAALGGAALIALGAKRQTVTQR